MSDKKTSIFRASALAKIRSPEQLDALLPITSPMSWVAITTIGFALAVILWWSIFGTILRTTAGEGIIVRETDFGIMEVSGTGTGSVTSILVESGDVVREGQLLATLDSSLELGQIENNQKTLASMIEQSNQQTEDEEKRLKILREKEANQQSLFDRGLITKTPLLETKNAIYEIVSRSYMRKQQILEQENKLEEMTLKTKQQSALHSAHPGRVTEVLVDVGDYVQPGRSIVRLESLATNVEASVYVPAADGKKVRPGMAIRIAPGTVKPEEYGYILATVTSVSPFPVGRDQLVRVLRNQDLAESLTKSGTAIAISADLIEDPTTPSGFRWSSSKGPPIKIESGTICSASVVLDRQAPITLLLPFLKKQLGIIY